MPKTRAPYPAEFREEMVRLVRAGRTSGELSREFEPSDQTIRNWVRQADIDEGHREGLMELPRFMDGLMVHQTGSTSPYPRAL